MDSGKKRDRSVNFNWKETEPLISLVKSKKNVIEKKKSDAATWKEKEASWMAIEEEFNRSSDGVYRDAKHLKSKYEALKRDTRKKVKHYKNGGEPSSIPSLTPAEEKLKDMILLSVEECESACDSDQSTIPGYNNIDIHHNESSKDIWNQCTLLESQKYDELGKTSDKRVFAKLIETKLEVALLQKKILKQEYMHKKITNELEQEQISLKIEILKKELKKGN